MRVQKPSEQGESMTKDEALHLALESFNKLAAWNDGEVGSHMDEPYSAEVAREAITAIKAALEAKDEPWEKFCDSHCVWTDHHPDCKLAQPEHCSDCGQKLGDANHIHTCSPQLKQEPVAYLSQGGNFSFEPWQGSTPLYTTQPQRKPLTETEILLAWEPHMKDGLIEFARAIEAAHGIKGEA